MNRIIIVALLVMVSVPSQLSAADGKIFLGLDFLSSHIGADDPQPGDPPYAVYTEEVGAGAGFYFGVSLSSTFKLRLYGSGASHDTSNPEVELRISGLTLEAMYMFSPDDALRPYLYGGLGGFQSESAHDQFRFRTDGPGVTFGFGLHYFLGRDFAFNLGLRGEWINWETATAELILPDGSSVSANTPVEESGFAGKFVFGGSVWF